MKVAWKKRFKPQVILDKISEIMNINEDGSISYSGFKYFELKATLYNMLTFPKHLTSIQNNGLVDRAITETVKSSSLTPNNLIKELQELFKKELNKKEKKYHLLSSISLVDPLPFKQINIGKSKIRFIASNYPKKYNDRKELIKKSRRRYSMLQIPHAGYTNIIITTKSKSEHQAASQCLDDIDLLRSLMSIFANSGMEIVGNEWSPINKIRLGELHTLHKASGKNINLDTFWFEPNFEYINPYRLDTKKNKTFIKNIKWVIKQLEKCKYSNKLESALLRYVRAFDERDQNIALLHIWGALESITAYEENSKDKLPKRCAYLFSEYEYHKQILEHLREYRNQSVHAGDKNDQVKSYCYQLQGYFIEIIFFHLHRVNQFNTLEEANSFLDQPVEIKQLKYKRDLLNSVIKFRGGE